VDARVVNGSGPVLVVHGGAGELDDDEDRRLYLVGVGEALDAGLAALPQGARAAVLAAVTHMEQHTIMNAGRGAALAADGTAALDAGFMDGATRRYGAVTGVRNCLTPVLLAERLSHEGEWGRFVAPPCAAGLPAEFGVPACAPEDLVTARARRLWVARGEVARAAGRAPFLDTVGAVALDAGGHVAAAVSTGGMSMKRPGRVGDSPVVGGGFWADDRAGACVATGVGEVLMREGSARRCVQLLAGGAPPAHAARQALAELADAPGDLRGASGLILVTPAGALVLDHSSREMSGGWARPGGPRRITHLWR
jgi:L-asparaginase / beta-aspartyl-peptidase